MHLLTSFLVALFVSKINISEGATHLPYGIHVPYPYGAKGKIVLIRNARLAIFPLLKAKYECINTLIAFCMPQYICKDFSPKEEMH